MTCVDQSGFGFTQSGPRSAHRGGIMVAHADGSGVFLLDDIETSDVAGSNGWGRCCRAWDYLIMSADEGFAPAVATR
jgi:hypothetical protein